MILRTSLSTLILFALAICPAASLCKPNNDCTFNLLSGDISVSARLIESEEAVGNQSPYYEFLIVISDKERRYEAGTGFWANDWADAVNTIKNSVKQKGGYTFVRHECAGGNAWRCYTEGVFTTRQGQLQYIGDIIGDEEKGTVGNNYSNGLFRDIYDKLEGNTLTDHASSPSLEIFSRNRNDRLDVDLETTWQRNLERFQQGKVVWNQLPSKADMTEEESYDAKITILPTLLEQAVIAKYCERIDEMEEVLRMADQSFSEDVMINFRAILDKIIPGELPQRKFKKIMSN